jgi:hypothetical protein
MDEIASPERVFLARVRMSIKRGQPRSQEVLTSKETMMNRRSADATPSRARPGNSYTNSKEVLALSCERVCPDVVLSICQNWLGGISVVVYARGIKIAGGNMKRNAG